MSATAKKSFAWLWIAALLSATVGISVHRIYCYCLGSTTYTLFAPTEGGCAYFKPPPEPAKSCCKKVEKPKSCCAAGEHKGPVKDHDCTKKTTRVFQLKTEFLVDKPFEKTFDFPLWLQDLPFVVRKLRPALCDASIIFNKAPPPCPPSGWQICLDHQLFRC